MMILKILMMIMISGKSVAYIFKCIGSLKEHRYQELLALAKKKINEGVTVQVSIKKELDNPVDSKAIAFACDVSGTWERIGYVVQESCD